MPHMGKKVAVTLLVKDGKRLYNEGEIINPVMFPSVSLLIHVKLKKSTVEFHISNKQLRQERMIRPSSTFIQYL
jgi:3-dehydroquinate dehydratase